MDTKIVKADRQGIEEAAQLMKSGGVVAFPTETVYGLGAIVYYHRWTVEIFNIKKRPSGKPLIVHICKTSQIDGVAKNVSAKARKLIDRFMPGPLTLVLQKNENVSDYVSGSTNTVSVRMPDNDAALMFIEKCGTPVAGTSANISNCPAPVSAAEVYANLNGRIPLILDGGECSVGEPSTVIDMTKEPPVVLRQGALAREEIEKVIGKVK